MEELVKSANWAGFYFGIGSAGRILFTSIVFTLDIILLINEFDLNGKDVFTATFLLFFSLMGIGN